MSRDKVRIDTIRTRLLSGCVGCMESFCSDTPVRCELKPQRRSTRLVGGARQETTQGHQHIAWIGSAIVDFQNIGISLRVEFIEYNQYAIVTGYCDTPGTSLLVWVNDWIARAGKVPRVTSILITGTFVCNASKDNQPHTRTASSSYHSLYFITESLHHYMNIQMLFQRAVNLYYTSTRICWKYQKTNKAKLEAYDLALQ